MKVITLINEKGGVGKTTLSTNLAVGLALRGHKVLFIDATPQANSTSALGLAKAPIFFDLLLRNLPWKDAIQLVPPDVVGDDVAMYAVASNFDTGDIAKNRNFKVSAVKRRLMQIENAFDFIVFDTMPNQSALHEGILYSTDYIVIPTKAAPFDVWQGLQDTVGHIDEIRNGAEAMGMKPCEILGIQINEYRGRTALQDHIFTDLKTMYGNDVVWEPIPLRQAIQDAQELQIFLFGHPGAEETASHLEAFVDRVLQGIEVIEHGD